MAKVVTTPLTAMLVATTVALSTSTPTAAREAGTLIWGMPAETNIFDPHATGGWSTWRVAYQIFEGLAKEDLTKADVPTPPLVPGLATSWDISPDGTVYTFKLRPGVKFHDGTPFDAAAVKFNFERFWDESSPNFYKKSKAFVIAYTKWIKSVEVVDPMTVRVTLKAANSQWLRQGLQSIGQAVMVSPEAVKKYGNDGIALHPIGTGAFRFVSREQGVRTVLERNPDYWGEPAKLDRIIIRPLQDPATRVNALENGEIQMMDTPPWDEIQRLVEAGFKLSTNPNVPFIVFLHLNFKNPAMQDIRVRKAMNMAIDREGIVREVYRSTGRAEYGMLSPGTDAYVPNFKSYSYDPEAAKKLLADAGYASGLKLTFELPQYGTGELVETWIQRDLQKVGIDVELKKYEWISYIGRYAGGMGPELGFNEIGWGMSTPSWIDIVSRCDSAPPGGVNSGWYCNKEVDKLLDTAILEQERTRRKEIYQQANRMIMDDAGFIPILDDLQPILLSPKVKGFVNPPEDWFDLSIVSTD